jgi:hypothetical protein
VVVGVLWILAALVILRVTTASVVTVGIVIGVLSCASYVQELVVTRISGGWRWLSLVFVGIILLIGSVVALFNFVLIEITWILQAVATQGQNRF